MTYGRSPGISFNEVPSRPAVPKADNEATIALVSIFEKGPVGVPTRVTTPDEFSSVFGGYTDNGVGAFWMDVFWAASGGSGEIYVLRVAHYTDITDASTLTAAKATVNLVDDGPGYSLSATSPATTTTSPALNMKVALSGEAAQSIALTGALASAAAIAADIQTKVRALTAAVPANQVDYNGFTCVVTATGRYLLRNGTISAGKTVVVTNGATDDVAASLKLGIANGGTEGGPYVNTLQVDANSEGVDANNISLDTVDRNLVYTETAAVITNGDTEIDLESIGNIIPGTILEITDITAPLTSPNPFYVEVDRIEAGMVVLTEAVVLTETVNIGSTVRSVEFDLVVKYDGRIAERFNGVSMNANSTRYVETVVNDSSSGSDLVTVTDLSTVSPVPLNNPKVVSDTFLTGGDDGLTGLVDDDYVGDVTAKTGIQAFRDYEDVVNYMAIPDQCTVAVQQAAIALGETMKFIFLGDLAIGLDKTAAIAYMTDTLRSSSDHANFGWPNHTMRDPRDRSQTMIIARSAANCGLRAAMVKTPGSGIWNPPGGPELPYKGVVGLEDESVLLESVRDELCDVRLNPETSWRNGSSIFNLGVKTLAIPGTFDRTSAIVGLGEEQKRAMFLKMRRDLRSLARSKLIRGATWALVREMVGEIEPYMQNLMGLGAFKGSTAEECYMIDTSGTTDALLDLGYINIKVGGAFLKATEFITFDLFEHAPPVTSGGAA